MDKQWIHTFLHTSHGNQTEQKWNGSNFEVKKKLSYTYGQDNGIKSIKTTVKF